MNKIEVRIKKWSTFWSVKIFDTGSEYPRVRTASSLAYLNTIIKDEDLNSSRFNVVGMPSSGWSNTIDFKPMKINWRTELSE